ncbi:MAG: nucleotidyl transferase AbiEii/AbiGii toxin family protein [Steroidobacteraceae bacterium]
MLARLLNRAKDSGDDYQTLLAAYCFERFLYRLGVSALRERFVLKGAMLLRLWSDQPYRATRDLDLLRRGDGSFEAIASSRRRGDRCDRRASRYRSSP